MISEKFVRIAREVIKFVRVGNKLKFRTIIYHNNTCCPLGAVCFNNDKPLTLKEFHLTSNSTGYYDFAYNLIGLNTKFEEGFDDYSIKDNNSDDEDYQIGYKLAEQCDIRGWIDRKKEKYD